MAWSALNSLTMAGSSRDKQLAEQRAARITARQAETAARAGRRRKVLAAALGVVVLAGLVGVARAVRGGDEPETAAARATPVQATAATQATGPCSYPARGAAAKAAPSPPSSPAQPGPRAATMSTSQGTIAFQLYADKAPCTVNSLRSLSAAGYYDGTSCHRLTVEGIFVLQCGDPTGTGRGGPGYSFTDENLDGATYPRGTVAMANSSAPGTNGSQFFLVYKDTALPPGYTPFGRITAGLDVLDKVAAAGIASPGPAPKIPVRIETLRLS